ncbi:alpha/beta hydrolase fold-domain-containing protein [Dactylonectria macrodidyma]|uniref:Alpha/beta hydrolase fold-domain-containing protein n=1 Tax=Dactylonectria macrodidyma TaxID=307937 RepID=A0A9P9J5C8_9HYPO|nr:alpha/beta hydrolase fold-domain-containing protein [Dactylonectria macrodidyma]
MTTTAHHGQHDPHITARETQPLSTTAQSSRLTVHERSDRYLMTRLLHAAIRPFRPGLAKAKHEAPKSTRLTEPRRAKKKCHVHGTELDGVWVYDLTQKTKTSQRGNDKARGHRCRILYFAGGGWQMPPSDSHWAFCTRLACELPNTKVTIVSYPLAPKNPVSVAYPLIGKAYKELMRQSTEAGEVVVVAGDSSGGNLALSLVTWTLLTWKDETVKPPAAILAISPTTDLRHEALEIQQVEKVDPILSHSFINSTASTWCPGPIARESSEATELAGDGHHHRWDWSFEDPRVSPILADLGPLVRHGAKIHGVTGSYDVLAPEAVAFREKCKQAGIEGEWLSWHGQMHCFPMAYKFGLKESRQAVEWIIQLLKTV